MTKQGFTVSDIRAGYSDEKRMFDISDAWIYFVVRPVSFYPTWLFIRLGISANKVTLVGFIVGTIGCVFFIFGSYWAAILGAVLINVQCLFDVIDGNVARYTNSSTKYGRYMDTFSNYILVVIMSITIGIGLYEHPDPYLNSLFKLLFEGNINNSTYLILGISAALFSILGELVTNSLWAVFSIKPTRHRPRPGSTRNLWVIVYRVGYALISFWRPLLLVAAIMNSLSIFLFLWVLLYTSDFIFLAIRALITTSKLKEIIDG